MISNSEGNINFENGWKIYFVLSELKIEYQAVLLSYWMPYAESSSARHETSCRTSILFSSQSNINSEYLFFGQKGVQTHSESVSWLMSWTDHIKGHLISKCLFGVFAFFQKTNENKSTSSKVEFVRSFFGRKVSLKKSFRIRLTFNQFQMKYIHYVS